VPWIFRRTVAEDRLSLLMSENLKSVTRVIVTIGDFDQFFGEKWRLSRKK
jgi:hypothetical protein